MSWLDGVGHRIRTLLRPGRYTTELTHEIEHHLDLDTMHQGDSRRAARRFGNRLAYREEARTMTWLRPLDLARQDLSTAWRALTRAPAVPVLVVAMLALGVGANAVPFTLLDTFYFRPPSGVADPGTLRRYWFEQHVPGGPYMMPAVSYPRYLAVTASHPNAAHVTLYSTDNSVRLGRGFGGPGVRVVYASASYFPVLGLRPAQGRFYSADEDRIGHGAPVAVVSHAFWTTTLGADPAVIGRSLALGTTDFTVIGVLDRSFHGVDLEPSDVWIPVASAPFGPSWWERPDHAPLFRIVERVNGQPPGLAPRATSLLRAFNTANGTTPDTLTRVHTGPIIGGPGTPGSAMRITTRLAGVAALVLLIALANVINLLLSRAVDRRQEQALRLALGVSRARLIRVQLLEVGMLAVLAAVAAGTVAWAGGTALRRLLMPGVSWATPVFDLRVALFTAVLALLAGLVAGLVPAVQASNPGLATTLQAGRREGSRHRSRLRSGLVVVQASLSVVLLVGAALFVQSLRRVQAVDIGFDADRLVFGTIEFPEGEAPPMPVVASSMREVAARVANLTGVLAVARVGIEPMRGVDEAAVFADDFGPEAYREQGDVAPFRISTTPSYFETVGLEVRRGRTMAGGDYDGVPAEVVVNEAMADLVWPGRDPIGRCLRLGQPDARCHVVVGVVENANWGYVIEPTPRAQYYLPLGSLPGRGWSGRVLVVRADPKQIPRVVADVRLALRERFPTAHVETRRMTENLDPEYRPWRLGATLFLAFGALALLVAMVGIYGNVAYGVSQRTHEFGVRAALGGRPGAIVRQVVGDSLRTVAWGVALGLGLALASGRLLAAMLYGIAPSDPVVLLGVTGCLLVVAAGAAAVPAWRAGRVDPLTALRSE